MRPDQFLAYLAHADRRDLDFEVLDLRPTKALMIARHGRYTRTLSSRAGRIEQRVRRVAKLKQMLFGRKNVKVSRRTEQFQLQELEVASAVEEHQTPAPQSKLAGEAAPPPLV